MLSFSKQTPNTGNMADIINIVDFLCSLSLIEHVARDLA